MRTKSVLISYTLAAMAGICFFGGIAILSGGEKEVWAA